MKLPNFENAVVDREKIVEYCLSDDHPRGKHKARVFRAACGMTAEHAELLRDALFDAAEHGEATPGRADEHGRRYVIEWKVEGPTGEAAVRTAWIVRSGEDFPRFVSAHVL